MSNDRVSRAQLIGGMVATGALAACGGRLFPNPVGNGGVDLSKKWPPLSLRSADRFGLDTVLARAPFKGLDKQAILNKYDFSPHIEAAQRRYAQNVAAPVQQETVITQIPPTGRKIAKPGTYRLGGDITWTPPAGSNNLAAITITASNVKLIFDGHTLKANISNKASQFSGVFVLGTQTQPLGNVTIENGTLANFTEYGVLATAVIGLSISEITVTGLCLHQHGLTKKHHQLIPAGILVAASVLVTISKCTVTKTNVWADVTGGILLIASGLTPLTPCTVSTCTVSSIVNNDGSAQGFSYLNSSYVYTSGCTVNSLQTFFHGNVRTVGHTCIGYVPTLSHDLTFTDCSAERIIGCCDDSHAMSLFMTWNSAVNGFTGRNVVDGFGENRGAKATGLEVYSLGNVTVTNSSVSDIKAINPEDLQAAGFSAWGMTVTFLNCTADRVSVVNKPKKANVRGLGFGWAPDPRPQFRDVGAWETAYSYCTANDCDVAFDTWNHLYSSWSNTSYSNCATGYLVEPCAMRTITCDPCSECDSSITAHLKNQETGNTINRAPIAYCKKS